MTRPLTIIAAVLASLLLVTGCGAADDAGGDVAAPGDETPIPVEPDGGIGDGAGAPAEEQEITGTFGGDAELEGGCAWVDGEDGTRYEVQYPDGYEVRFDPVELVGPDGDVIAEDGDTITIRGRVDTDMMSFCMVGTIFSADEVEA
jgi:hypothetical protein